MHGHIRVVRINLADTLNLELRNLTIWFEANKISLNLLPFNIKKFSVFFRGLKFYNSLNSKIINSNSICSFKKAPKKWVINNLDCVRLIVFRNKNKRNSF